MRELTYNESQKNHFPIIIQLAILGLILVGVFSTLLFQLFNPSQQTPTPIVTEPISPQPAALSVVTLDEDAVDIVAEAAYVWDVNSEQAVYTKNATESLPLASITKLMTALVAYELVAEETDTSVPSAAIMQEGSSGFTVGETISLRSLSEMALISSSNDAAYALGASVGQLLGDRDASDQFVTAMNIRAEELGLDSMLFYNSTGLDISTTEAGAYGSARDVSLLMQHIVRNYPELIDPTTETTTRVYNATGAFHDVANTNDVVTQIPNLIGSKTGFTDLAGGNLTVAFDAGLDRPIIVTVLGSTYQDRFQDVLELITATQAAITTQ